jgi:RNA polymerase sigma-70 factor (ECF subfamily)
MPPDDTLTQIPAALGPHEFTALAEQHRRALQAHCYRMVGSPQEAEELTQEALLRAWRGRDTYAGRAPLRAWLYKIATNLCLDALARRPRRSLPMTRGAAATPDAPVPPELTEPIWLEPIPDDLAAGEESNPEARYSLHESLTLAFLTALHRLPPRQRAVLILRDVLDWPADEVAGLLNLSVPAVKSLLHRARSALSGYYPAGSSQSDPRPDLDQARRGLLERYVRAWEAADVEALTALLKSEATFSMPPTPAWYQGRENVRALVARTIFAGPARGRWRLLPLRANSQPGFGLYRLDESAGGYGAYGIQVLTLDGAEIADIITFRSPGLARVFQLPATLPA